ncbi:unnamed protein product [Rotaria magnacalcarata]|uniref:Multifunctional fusion protein n=1 Tax=Rotaria magnacalcarata TaxID=392030 RepID=A0A814XV96_9BILA|nr:unnamed protein product [Rotaria magnacalcarata]CAF1464914.1 unnamed protein product [Rotaria magnacalcarata]CAF2059644.1 unnamed protein product [Rotaria magnacalcarata]CAF2069698.1 unnamed protein product [Rotaria magnacalcarata]CAF2215175.1 unnamed protein product [Rotaria magnacalcarata]
MYRLQFRRCASTFSTRYTAKNEPILEYRRGGKEVKQLEETLNEYKSKLNRIPCIVDGKEVWTNSVQRQLLPFDHQHVLAEYCLADPVLLERAIESGVKNRSRWEQMPVEERANIFLKAADLGSDLKWRSRLLASTMLGQGKTIFQAEIDAACEVIDFWRFNVQYLASALAYSPISTRDSENTYIQRGLEGFVAAVSPFNFTAIGANLASSPALMGNTVLWKSASTAILSNYVVYKLLEEAGLPPGVIQFVPSKGGDFGRAITRSPHLAAITFTGSTDTFMTLWKWVADNIGNYRTFPRMIGECGGKNFHLIHSSADPTTIVYATIRSAFEYSGQKCSACSRVYLPRSMSKTFFAHMKSIMMNELKIGSPLQHETFTSAVIDRASFDNIRNYIEYARSSPTTKILVGGQCDDSVGFYVQPTLIETTDPKDKLMCEEIFGPVLTVYVYEDDKYDETLELIDQTSNYALTGSIFCKDENVLKKTRARLMQAMGNLYINDKSTGAVVNQQPFGGARLSGTNDKAGGPHYIFRFSSPLAVKNMKEPLKTFKHASME